MTQFIQKGLKYPVFRILMVLTGAFIASIAVNALYVPNQILSGGVTGIAILLNLKLGLNISMVMILLNIPIFFFGYKMIHREFIIYSLIGMLANSIFIQLTRSISFHSESELTTLLFGGVMSGIGFGLIFRAGASTGGNDIISKVLNRRYSYSISTFNFIFNLVIISLSVTTFGIDKAVETLTTLYVSTLTITFILEGSNYKRTLLIITENQEAVAEGINRQLSRGCTIIAGKGSYTQNERHLLYAVISINQVARVRSIVSAIDPHAFVNVIETKVVFGNGFLNIKDE